MPHLDDGIRNRRGCFIIVTIALLGIAGFLFLYFRAPTSERGKPLSNGSAPVTNAAPLG